jgi:HD-like signal output (HDOD) protein
VITQQAIENYIEKIPPSPKILKQTLVYLNAGELVKAAKIAEGDIALKAYLKSIVNKPIYGFSNEVSDISQIFGILGVSGSQQCVYNYMINLLSPSKWKLFKLNRASFDDLQAQLSTSWKKILEHLDIKDKDIESAITLLPSSIIIAEALFCEKIEDVNLLRSTKNLDFNTILLRLCQMDLFDICEAIALKWEMPSLLADIVLASSGIREPQGEPVDTLGKWMHLLLFYELSKPTFAKAGLNDFIEFQIDFVSDIYEEFATLMEIQ